MKHIKFKQWICRLERSHYNTPPHPPALMLMAAVQQKDEQGIVWPGERIAVATVYIENCPLAPGEVVIKSWSENDGMAETLIAAGVIGPELRRVPAGFCEATIHKLL